MKTAAQRAVVKIGKMLALYDSDCVVRDLLADLRHYCDAAGIDFADEDRIAYNNYVEERNGQ